MLRSAQRFFFPLPVGIAAITLASVFSCVTYAGAAPKLPLLRLVHSVLARVGGAALRENDAVRTMSAAWLLASISVMGLQLSQQLLLKTLLKYHGWLTEGRGKTSTATTVWGLLMKFAVWGRSKDTFAYTSFLPKLPVPPLADTVARYVASMEPILPAGELATLRARAAEFAASPEARGLQQACEARARTESNYVDAWWLNYAYLRPRDSIVIGSNYYALTLDSEPMTRRPAARAAYYLWRWLVAAKTCCADEALPPQMLANGTVPFCMEQYRRVLSLTRVPGKDVDRLVHYKPRDSMHVVAIRGGRFFKVDVFNALETAAGVFPALSSPAQIELAFQKVIDGDGDSSQEPPAERDVANLTGWQRSLWASAREELFLKNETNRAALETIESAIMAISFDDDDDDELEWDDLEGIGHSCLHGRGGKFPRWCDKSVTMVMSNTAVMSLNCEHSFADAPMVAHFVDECMAGEWNDRPYERAAGGRVVTTLGRATTAAPATSRIAFDITPPLAAAIAEATAAMQKAGADLDLRIARFTDFGKQAITKQFKLSPDAFIQAALATAYFRTHGGRFVQTYESASMRLFLNGRTDTIRPVTSELAAFVKALCEADADPALRASAEWKARCIKLFRAASDRHSANTCQVMVGNGVDRHLFALYIASVEAGAPNAFLRDVLARGWKLSTSQTPLGQSASWKDKNHANTVLRANGGFGPVHADGIGCSYVPAGDSRIVVHVSSHKSSPETDSTEFLDNVLKAFNDFKALF